MKGIIMSAESVRGIQENRKTMTRRAMNPQPVMDKDGMWRWKDCQWMDGGLGFPESGIKDHARYKPGDILYVKETHRISDPHGDFKRGDRMAVVTYKAGGDQVILLPSDDLLGPRWRSPMFMPRAAVRLFLRVTDVRVERLQEITAKDAVAEGIIWEPGVEWTCWNDGIRTNAYVSLFADHWDGINAKRGHPWSANDWVWAYTFERISKEEAA